MERLWKNIDRREWMAETKYAFVIIISTLLSSVTGLVLWALVRNWALSTIDWMVCFMGYPAVVSWIALFIYSAGNELHNGSYPEE